MASLGFQSGGALGVDRVGIGLLEARLRAFSVTRAITASPLWLEESDSSFAMLLQTFLFFKGKSEIFDKRGARSLKDKLDECEGGQL